MRTARGLVGFLRVTADWEFHPTLEDSSYYITRDSGLQEQSPALTCKAQKQQKPCLLQAAVTPYSVNNRFSAVEQKQKLRHFGKGHLLFAVRIDPHTLQTFIQN
jgi:hypothetical protein